MPAKIPFKYGEFYDVPRQIRFTLRGRWYFMRSFFKEEKDDYSECYDLYILPFFSEEEIRANPDYWYRLEKARHLGTIPLTAISLDQTRRQSFESFAVEKLCSDE